MSTRVLFDGHLMDGPFSMGGVGVNCRNNKELVLLGLFDGCLTERGFLGWVRAVMGPRKTRKDTDEDAFFSEFRAFRRQKRGLA